MANGIITLGSSKSNLEGRIVWESSINDIVNNNSNVTARIQVRRNDGYTTQGTWSGAMRIGTVVKEFSLPSTYVGSAWITMLEFTNVQAHEDNGEGTCFIEAYCNAPSGTSLAGQSVSGKETVTLDKIPRTSSVTCADGNIGSSTIININRASTSFKHTLKYAFGTLTGTIVTKTADTSYGWTIPTSFYAQIPNSKIGQGTITCETYDGDSLIGTSTCKFNAIVLEANNTPTITATIVDDNATTKALTGDANKLIKYFSNAKVTMTATAKNSATIKSQKVICGGQSKTTATSTIEAVESGTFNLSCTDSRGFAGTNEITKTMIDYVKLAITSLDIKRESSTSNTIKINLKGNYFNGSFGSVANTLTLKWRYRIENGDWSDYTTVTPTKSGNTFSYSGNLGTNFDYQQAYEFEVVAQDKLMTDPKTRPVTAGTPLVDMWKGNVKINGFASIPKGKAFKFDNENTIRKTENGATLISATGDSGSGNRIFLRPNGDESTDGQVVVNKSGDMSIPGFTNLNKITSKTINADFKTAFRTQTRGDTNKTNGFISTIRNDTANVADSPQYGSGLAWGRSDTHGYLNTNFASTGGSHTAIIGAGNADKLNWVGKIAIPKNLYNNTSGTDGTVTLSETSANFSYFDIFFLDTQGGTKQKSVRVYAPNGKTVNLEAVIKDPTQDVMFFFSSIIQISGTQITFTYKASSNMYAGSATNYSNTNSIKIVRIDGYR